MTLFVDRKQNPQGGLTSSEAAARVPTQSIGFLAQNVGGSYVLTTIVILDKSTLLPNASAAAFTTITAAGAKSFPSNGPVIFTDVTPEMGLSIGLPVMVTMTALYMALWFQQTSFSRNYDYTEV